MEAIGVKSKNTYYKSFNDLVEWRFFILIEASKNQNTANIITLSATSKNKSAVKSALDSATIQQASQHLRQQEDSVVPIDKQVNKETINLDKWIRSETKPDLDIIHEGLDSDKKEVFELWINYRIEIKKKIKVQLTLNNLIEKFNSNSLEDCKTAVNSSIDNQYTGLFWKTGSNGKNQQNKQTRFQKFQANHDRLEIQKQKLNQSEQNKDEQYY
jgi:hypothetical protein